MAARNWRVALLAGLALVAPLAHAADDNAQQQQSLDEVRNTVINLLQALVDRGLITREQAETLVKQAQEKAAAEAAKNAAVAKEEANAVRVPYVPEIVKDEIAKNVEADLAPSIQKSIQDNVASKGSLAAALPTWVQNIRWGGDMRLRLEGDRFAHDNAQFAPGNGQGAYIDYNQVNSKGGFQNAGFGALLNVTNSQTRLRVRARVGLDADLGSGWSTAFYLATGSTGEIVATTNQTLGTYGAGYTATIDQGYLRWTGNWSDGDQVFTAYGGRFSSPWLSTDLVWYNDLTFEGLVGNYRLNFSDDDDYRKELFLTVAGMPLSSFSPLDSDTTDQQKWLLGAQIGADVNFEDRSRLRLGGAYYDYLHTLGRENALGSTLYNWSAPAFVQKGNTLYDISNPLVPGSTNLYALASQYKIVDLIAMGDLHVVSRYSANMTVEGVRNIGYKTAQVSALYGNYQKPRNRGYRIDVGFGTDTPPAFGSWRATLGYRYLQRDAVLDAFNDEDFHLGGTDAKGYTAVFDFNVNPRVYLRMKYMAANEIDGLRLGIDVWQFDINGHF